MQAGSKACCGKYKQQTDDCKNEKIDKIDKKKMVEQRKEKRGG